ncbi:MAG: hypothetical protein DMG06_16730 [Acidobacteria bacterium]|nr:MAG: hypothetical protein DMG06_16730 [Acidobacteriota bacterium]
MGKRDKLKKNRTLFVAGSSGQLGCTCCCLEQPRAVVEVVEDIVLTSMPKLAADSDRIIIRKLTAPHRGLVYEC